MGFKLKNLTKSLAKVTNVIAPISNVFGEKGTQKKIEKGIGSAYNLWGQKSPFKAPSPGPPGEDPNVTALRNKMYGEAQDYREKLPGMINEQDQLLQRDASNAQEAGVHATRKNMNDRGLLYSGLRESSEGDVKSRVASGLARSQADVRKGFEDTAAAKEQTAAAVGLSGYQDALRRSNELFNQQMEKNTKASQNMQALGQAGGYAAGAYSKGGFNQQQQQPQGLVGQPQAGSSYQPTASLYQRYGDGYASRGE